MKIENFGGMKREAEREELGNCLSLGTWHVKDVALKMVSYHLVLLVMLFFFPR